MGFELKRKLDYSDLQVTPDDGNRYELVEGQLCVSRSSTPIHQTASRELVSFLVDYFESRSIGEVFKAPIDLILTPHDVFVPDLIVVTNPSHVTERAIEGPPLLVVEIVLPSTRHMDLTVKPRRYAELGVEHYWIVDPEAQRLQCFRSVSGAFQPLVEAEGDATLAHPTWDGLEIDLGALWRHN